MHRVFKWALFTFNLGSNAQLFLFLIESFQEKVPNYKGTVPIKKFKISNALLVTS